MSWRKNAVDATKLNAQIDPDLGLESDPALDPILEQALEDFRAHAHAWSEARYGRPQAQAAAGSGWRPALAWALGCVLVAGGVSGAFYEHHQREATAARLALLAREAQQKQEAVQQRAADEDLLATVDSDISREVPAAMQPLANLMDEDSGQ
jgi:hypothetical protein